MTISAALVKELREKTGAAMMACKKALEETKGDLEAAIEVLRKSGEAKAAKRADKTAAEGKIEIAVAANHESAFIVEVNSETDFVARDENFRLFVEKVAQQGLKAKSKEAAAVLAEKIGGQPIETIRQTLVSKIGENVQIRRASFVEAPFVGCYAHGERIGVLVAIDQKNAALAKDLAMHIAATYPQAIYPEEVSADLVAKEKEIFMSQAADSGKPADIIRKMVDGRVNKFLKEISLTSQPFVKDPNKTVAELLKAAGAKVLSFVRYEVGEGIEKETQNFADEVMAQVQRKN